MASALINSYRDSWLLFFKDQWKCPFCSSPNSICDYPDCTKCKQSNPNPIDDLFISDQSIPIWSCPKCTLHNEINRQQCKICGIPKPESDQSEANLVNAAINLPHGLSSLPVRTRRHKDESNAEELYQRIVKYCKQNKTNFVDDRFVPCKNSIGTRSFDKVAQWLRISDTASSSDDHKLKWTIFSSPEPSDIQQGALGNCWLIAALALVCEQQRLLEHILLTKETNREGVYLVRVCHNGLWQTVIIDDYFPCTKHKHLVFTKAKRRQMYVPLIEKACAKVFGSYANLASGNMLEGLQLLTGAPCDYIDLDPQNNYPLDKDFIWTRLISACTAKLLIGAASGKSDVKPEEYARVRIHGNHAFSILAVHTLVSRKDGGDSSRFVLVRDPHSRSSYTEEAATDGVLQELKSVNPARRSTGAFWILWPKFLRYFSSLTVSTYNSDHFDIRETGKFTQSSVDNITSYLLHVPQSSMVNISLLYHRDARKTRTYHTQSFVLCDADDLKTTGVVGQRQSILICKRGGFTYWPESLQAGYYVLIPFSTSFWQNNEKNRNYTLVIHSNVQLQLSAKSKAPTFLADCLISAVIKNGKKEQIHKDAAFYRTSHKLGMKLFVAENLSKGNHLYVDVNIKVGTNVRHSRCSHIPCTTQDSLSPRHRQIIFLSEWADKRGQPSQLNYSYSQRFGTRPIDSKPPITSSRDFHSARPF